ncbi:fibronectin type III domain-containing protein [Paenibacillus sp. ACRSA]|uniref:fibronectin type III domain-containing protein n=1 Tax=Paenibacillus sp. ACRSA TaxID=2918211 RepID=UPI001EF4655E|nr:fibronectin type III domain-containing protein [Paenibacillus sp. ACRSA]MCG7380596.1 fibronectin type III domain-containing protein [Paenibacillus sp. ACRSA]
MRKRIVTLLVMILVVLCLTPAGFVSAAGTKYIDIGSNVSLGSLRFIGSGVSSFEIFNDKGERVGGFIQNLGDGHTVLLGSDKTARYVKFTEVGTVTNAYYGVDRTADIPINNIVSVSPIPLPTPTKLSGVASDKKVSLSWSTSTSSEVTGYNVYLNNVKQNTTPITSGRYVVNNLNNGTSYKFSVTSVNSRKESAKTTISQTPIDNVAPAVPKNVVLVPGNRQIEIDWSDNTEADLAGYNIYRDGIKINTELLTSSYFVDIEREIGITYSYRISAVDTTGNESGRSTAVTGTIIGTNPPNTPAGLVGTAGDSLVTLTWIENTNTDLAYYNIYQNGVFLAKVDAPTTTYVVSNLTNGTSYNFTITAVDTYNSESDKSNEVNLIPQTAVMPIDLTGNAGDKQVILNWTSALSNDNVSYNIYQNDELISSSVYLTTYTVLNLTNGQTYAFNVTGVDASGNEYGKSETVHITPQASDKTRALLTIYVSGGQIKEYDLTMVESQAFIDWYEKKEAGTGSSTYKFSKNWNKGSFKTRTEYIIFDKVLSFDVDEYEVENNE